VKLRKNIIWHRKCFAETSHTFPNDNDEIHLLKIPKTNEDSSKNCDRGHFTSFGIRKRYQLSSCSARFWHNSLHVELRSFYSLHCNALGMIGCLFDSSRHRGSGSTKGEVAEQWCFTWCKWIVEEGAICNDWLEYPSWKQCNQWTYKLLKQYYSIPRIRSWALHSMLQVVYRHGESSHRRRWEDFRVYWKRFIPQHVSGAEKLRHRC
jgi:hypothetical protein